ncbi:hypothetical protein HDU67_008001 [Dinochytrium kinnereticum]|nr:hypothetical protein HDU67_008001 [Dinochytrium kinnereticum]
MPPQLEKNRENLKELRLVKSNLSEQYLLKIATLAPNLTRLLLSDRGIINDSVVLTFSMHCPHVTICSLSGCNLITDKALLGISLTWGSAKGCLTKLCLDQTCLLTSNGLKALLSDDFAKRVESLSLFGCAGITDEGIAALITNPVDHLTELNVGGLSLVSTEAVESLIRSRGGQLKVLGVNGFASLSDTSIIQAIAQYGSNLVKLDLGRCEYMDKAALENMLGCLTKLKVFHADGIDVQAIEEEGWDISTMMGADRDCKVDTIGRMTFAEFPPLNS